MAAITTHGNRRIIQFRLRDGRRGTISLRDTTESRAITVRDHIEELITAPATGHQPRPATRIWLNELPDDLYARLVEYDLAAPRLRYQLATVIAEFCASRQDVKASTRASWKQAHDALISHFGKDHDLAKIHAGDADDWRQKQIGAKLRDATIRKRTRAVNTLMAWAIRRKYITENPFAHLPAASIEGRDKPYVPAADAWAVIEALPSVSWKLLVALGRFAGLRVPSEALALRWEHIDFAAGKMTVPVPKLAHIAGKGTRVVPLFTAIQPLMLEAFAAAEPGQQAVLALPACASAYLRKIVENAARRAGVKPWRCTFHALRASCETDLAARHPVHLVASWIGHDLRIAQRHYLKALDTDFKSASASPGAHGAAKSAAPSMGVNQMEQSGMDATPAGTLETGASGNDMEPSGKKWAIQDLNQSRETGGKTQDQADGAAESAARTLTTLWPSLSPACRDAIRARLHAIDRVFETSIEKESTHGPQQKPPRPVSD